MKNYETNSFHFSTPHLASLATHTNSDVKMSKPNPNHMHSILIGCSYGLIVFVTELIYFL